VPVATPVTIPVLLPIVAIAVLLLVHVPPEVAQLRVVVFAAHVVALPVMVAGTAFIVTSCVL
jgi:hypothetical protein